MVALLVEGRGMWRIEGLGRWVTSVSELPGALTRTNSHAARRGPGALIQRAFSRRYPSFLHRGERRRGGFHPFLPLTWPRLASPHLTSPHLTSPHLTSLHLTSLHLAMSRLHPGRRAHERIKAAASPKHPRTVHSATSYDVSQRYGQR